MWWLLVAASGRPPLGVENVAALKKASGKQPVLAMVHTDWCGYCVQAAEKFPEVADNLPGVTVAELVNPSDADLVELEVREFPTYVLLAEGAYVAALTRTKSSTKIAEWTKKSLQDRETG